MILQRKVERYYMGDSGGNWHRDGKVTVTGVHSYDKN